MNLEKAAQALVECGYAVPGIAYEPPPVRIFNPSDQVVEEVDPINNEAQRQALLEWFVISVHKVDVEGARWVASIQTLRESLHLKGGKTRIEAENACLEEILK